VHGPSPFAYPHSLSEVSQTELWQTSVAAATVHVPFSVGFVWGGSVGTVVPFARRGVQVCALSLHQLPDEQSASTLQPPAGWQTPAMLHEPERQTVPPVRIVHGPSPLAKPQRLSAGSQTPLEHVRVPACSVHVPLRVGFVWGGSFATGCPLGAFGVQTCDVSLHQVPAKQSPSTLQPPAGLQVPLVLQEADWQTMPPLAIVQGPSPFA
jgi:hypothetical protein